MYEVDYRWAEAQNSTFNKENNAYIKVSWIANGSIPTDSRRYYFIYFIFAVFIRTFT